MRGDAAYDFNAKPEASGNRLGTKGQALVPAYSSLDNAGSSSIHAKQEHNVFSKTDNEHEAAAESGPPCYDEYINNNKKT
jgi:hypothetical protein